MADSTLAALPAAAALSGPELLYGVQAAGNVKITATQMQTFVGSGFATLGANTFTALQTITQASANAGIIASTGYSLTGSNATNMVDLAGTWNTSGNPVALKIAITDTTSGATSKFASFLAGAAGATEIFSLAKTGNTVWFDGTRSLTLEMNQSPVSTPSLSANGTNLLFLQTLGAAFAHWAGGVGFYTGDGVNTRINANAVFGWVSDNRSDTSASDLKLTRKGAANLQHGAADAAAPVAQTLSVQSVVAGTSNTAGANLTITGSQGTGTGAGGDIIFQTAPAGTTGTSQNALAERLKIASTGVVTLTGSTGTWTLTPGVTNSSTIAASGNMTISGGALGVVWNAGATCINPTVDDTYDLGYSGGNPQWKAAYTARGYHIFGDVHLCRRGTASLLLGNLDAAAPVAQTLSVQSVVAGTSNTAGADWNITGSLSTGSGIAGKIIFNLSQIVAAATAQNAASPVITLSNIIGTGIRFNGYGAGAITSDASGNLTAASDERMKDVLGEFTDGLAELERIQPIRYRWKDDSGMEPEHEYAGFAAGNVKDAIPMATGLTPDGYMTLQDRALLAACVNAIKQLATEIRR